MNRCFLAEDMSTCTAGFLVSLACRKTMEVFPAIIILRASALQSLSLPSPHLSLPPPSILSVLFL